MLSLEPDSVTTNTLSLVCKQLVVKPEVCDVHVNEAPIVTSLGKLSIILSPLKCSTLNTIEKV